MLNDKNIGLFEPDKVAALEIVRSYDRSIRHRDSAGVSDAALRYSSLVSRLNGGTLFGCEAEGGAGLLVADAIRAIDGSVPLWGQSGRFVVTIDGVRVLVESAERPSGFSSLSAHVVDIDCPFISSTGYLSLSGYWTQVDRMGLDFETYAYSLLSRAFTERPLTYVSADAYCREEFTVPDWVLAREPSPTGVASLDSDQYGFSF